MEKPMSQVLRYSPDGQFWWNGQQWLPVPPRLDFVPIQSTPSSSLVNWKIIVTLLVVVLLAVVVAGVVTGVNSFNNENRDYQNAYCQDFPNDPSC
jgi:hypothetical protein